VRPVPVSLSLSSRTLNTVVGIVMLLYFRLLQSSSESLSTWALHLMSQRFSHMVAESEHR
jgi:hypothetical protein